VTRAQLALAGRTAVVTGAGSGIGRALALHAAGLGMAVAICDVDEAGLSETTMQLSVPHVARLVDVTEPAELERFAIAARGLPPVALLFANAGILRQGSMTGFDPAMLGLILSVNVVGVVATVQAFLPMLRANAPAQVVVTASTGAMASFPHLAAYCASKHALWPIADGLREDLAGDGIGVSMLMPGAVETAIFDASDPDHQPAPDTISPAEAARIAFAGAMSNHRLILTHPHFIDRARARFDAALEDLAATAD
jgi:NAD(P)-dependent dehydrogenase (short-subunit alcohol dehydrogenase family)